ncbi:sulfate ABC transporter permease subunit CysT [Parvibaculum sedimenti]|uniref:Sulfate transport system permease protein CysT n=1 Tax=Parvibaculum sedimenti TaxID=2608632 RepID=A0A6N6VRD0_9HYPH|nr:sulfate ABC transporter permease subunit CysT [Parvibaculum sedimenti]KAB7742083.1 sulfate ABC transporter permease subunit CysT [Parvibaculum sedimenti]
MSLAILTERLPRRAPSVMPGFGLTLGFSMAYLGLIVLIPLAGVFIRSAGLGWSGFWELASDERTVAALKLSFGAALAGAAVNAIAGLLVAWVLVRYSFPGRRLVDAAIDLPFALPTAVSGLALAALYAPNGWIGSLLADVGIRVAFTPLGVVVACVFIGLPFVVRTLQPVLNDLEPELEEAAATLGATRFQTVLRVIFPALLPPLLTGFALAFARAVGEYGSIIFIAGNLPYKSEIAPLLIIIRLEEFNYGGATAVATVMLLLSFIVLLIVNLLQAWSRRRTGFAS